MQADGRARRHARLRRCLERGCLSLFLSLSSSHRSRCRPLLPYQTHCDIIEDFDADLVAQLTALAQELDFQIFEDRKFADIGEAV